MIFRIVIYGLFLAMCLSGCINLRYPAPANDPLKDPVKVRDVPNNSTLVLEDGRRIRLELSVPELRDRISESDNLVEIGTTRRLSDGTFEAEVFVKECSTWICGTPYARLISIPIFPDRVLHYERVALSHMRLR